MISEDIRRDRRRFLVVLLAAAVVHSVLAVVLPISGDEVYYWDCSRHPDWSYFDQPALVIWSIGLSRAVLGETNLAIRMPVILASLAIGLMLAPLMRRLGGGLKEATTAYLLLHGMPIFFVFSFYSSTDTVMWAFYLAALWAAVAIAQGEERAWWGFGLAVGIGFLAKFPVFLAVGGVLGALTSPAARAQLKRPTPWLAALLSFALTAPVWIWGAQHDWDNIAFQLVGRHTDVGGGLAHLAEFVGGTLLAASPPLLVAMVLAWGVAVKRREPAWWALFGGTLSTVLFFGLVSLRAESNGHWTAPALITSMIPVVLFSFRWKSGLLKSGVAFTAVLISVLLALVLNPDPLLDIEGLPQDELAKMYGNQEIADEVERRLEPGELAASERYSAVHEVAFRTQGRVPTRLGRLNRGQHGLASLYWYPVSELEGRDLLFFTGRAGMDAKLRSRCARVEELPDFAVRQGDRVLRRIRFYRCHDLQKPEEAFTRLPREEE